MLEKWKSKKNNLQGLLPKFIQFIRLKVIIRNFIKVKNFKCGDYDKSLFTL